MSARSNWLGSTMPRLKLAGRYCNPLVKSPYLPVSDRVE